MNFCAVAVVAALLSCQTLVQAAGWWSNDYGYRRSIVIPVTKASHLGGDDIAVFNMPTCGLCKPDGSDIRVTTYDGKDRPAQVLSIGPGEQALLAFGIQNGVTNYHVYLGCTKNPPPQKPLEIQRGVLLETWAFEGGGVGNVQQVQEDLENSTKLLGRSFRPNIFLGHNPFGPDNRIINFFTGYLQCPKDGPYTFATASRDASFLLIDNKVVVASPGFHEIAADVRSQGRVTLKAGLHKLTYYHACGGGDPICVAAWKQPGADKIWLIEPESFAPIIPATVGPIEEHGHELSIDFFPQQMGETFINNRYYQRYSFKAVAFGTLPPGTQWNWELGDGQTGKGETIEHVYLLPGEYTVTLKTKTIYGPLNRGNKIFVTRPWDRVVLNEVDSVGTHGNIVMGYDFAALKADAVAQAIVILGRCDKTDVVIAAGDALTARDKAAADALDVAMPIYAQALAAKGQSAKAAVAMLKAAKMTDNPATRAGMTVAAAQQLLQLGGTDDLQKALDLFEESVRKYEALTTAPAIRLAKVGAGDVWRMRGDLEKASHAYADAHPLAPDQWGSDAVSKGDFARHVEEYLRSGDLNAAQEFISSWEQAFPMDKVEGYWSLLKVRLCMAQNNPAAAAAEVNVLVGVNPASNYAAQLLMLQNQAYEKLNDAAKARDALQRIVDKYKESPLAAEAAKKLAAKK